MTPNNDAPHRVDAATAYAVFPAASAPEIDVERAFLRATKRFASGVTVVTTQTAAGLHGMTVSGFLFVSRAPRLVLVSLGTASSMLPRIEEAGAFAVSVLPDDGQHLAERFAKRGAQVDGAFTDVPHAAFGTGAPVLAAAVAWFDCRLRAVQDAGDHCLIMGEVQATGERDGDPLLYYRSRYARLSGSCDDDV